MHLEQATLKLYESCLRAYLSHAENRHKANDFRTAMEAFLKDYLKTEESQIANLLRDFYTIHRERLLQDVLHQIKSKINEASHGYNPSDQEVQHWFEGIIQSFWFATQVKPPQQILDLIGLLSEDILSNLYERQRMAVLDEHRVSFVDAGPGSGKTHLLTHKIFYAIEKSEAERPLNVVALSFTNMAAQELRQRIIKLSLGRNLKKSQIYSATIHSFAHNALKTYYTEQKKEPFDYIILSDDEETRELYNMIAAEIERETTEWCNEEIVKALVAKKVDDTLSIAVRNAFTRIWSAYRVIDFEGILDLFLDTLNQSEEFTEWLTDRLNFLLVDEAQDLNKKNYEVIHRLAEKIPNLSVFLVGDPRQNIYRWRGGAYKHLEQFLRNWGALDRVISLDKSRRCPKPILEVLNRFRFVDCINHRLDAVHPDQEEGSITRKDFYDWREEAEHIVQVLREQNSLDQSAILVPNLNYLLPIAYELNHHSVRFVVKGGKQFLFRHIKLALHILRLIQNRENAYSWTAVQKRIDVSKELFFSKVDSDLIKSSWAASGCSFLLTLFSDALLIEFERNNTSNKRIEQWKQQFAEHRQMTSRMEICRELLREDMEVFDHIARSYRSLEDFLNAASLNNEQLEQFYEKDFNVESTGTSTEAVTLSTIHSAKGLEWNHVFIPGMADGLFPNPYFAEKKGQPEETALNYNDDRKKLYVAMSRALHTVYITVPKQHANNSKGMSFRVPPSRFLGELGL